jgi:hypothetical protein
MEDGYLVLILYSLVVTTLESRGAKSKYQRFELVRVRTSVDIESNYFSLHCIAKFLLGPCRSPSHFLAC